MKRENKQIKAIIILTKNRFGVSMRERTCFVCPEHEEKFRNFKGRGPAARVAGTRRAILEKHRLSVFREREPQR